MLDSSLTSLNSLVSKAISEKHEYSDILCDTMIFSSIITEVIKDHCSCKN